MQSVVAKRLVKYSETTLPLLDFYDKLGLLHSFKGSSSDEIYPQLKALLVSKGMMPRKYSASFTTFDKC